jgi:hypothetical protein
MTPGDRQGLSADAITRTAVKCPQGAAIDGSNGVVVRVEGEVGVTKLPSNASRWASWKSRGDSRETSHLS